MAGFRSLQCLALLLAAMLLVNSSSAAATTTTTNSRKLLVAPARTSPETASGGQKQEMDVGRWRTAAPFRRPGASLGRHVPGSNANPSHN
ncbi:Os02g0459001 [Oryza sativa Japonica Group]|uniref:Os02g0459001 protein n=1 Tax=Oryza sativa subsp. japonica TaxID=39947 RepID=A0A0P0VIP2_ORYSJ|nr:hypothetical protein EE612_011151 [Oryza sativa]KAF2944678.1 hypothetical protein DAI22_02g160400 [Oryza sativa Japonica Group]BAS78538.1 Os02g0459001 [Oryza sativa Japonica Group]